MALSKIQAESMNLADTYAFTGTVSGAGDPATEVLITSGNTSSGSSTAIVVDNCFTSTYTAYRIVMWEMMTSGGTNAVGPRWIFRTGGSSGSDLSSSVYSARSLRNYSGHTNYEMERVANENHFKIGYTATQFGSSDSNNAGMLDMNIYGTNGHQLKCVWNYCADHSGADTHTIWNNGGGAVSQTTAITGFKFYSNDSRTITHYKYRVLGLI